MEAGGMMVELGKREIEGLLRFNQKSIVVYFYSPLCGTCKLSTQMLDIALEALPEVNIYKCNINSTQEIAAQWQITSVPCLVILSKDKIINKVYALKSVAHIYELLKPLQHNS
jgi:thioredoxin-like negative regulator of GroEL